VDNEKVDQFLASAFGSSKSSTESDKPGPEPTQEKPVSKVPSSGEHSGGTP